MSLRFKLGKGENCSLLVEEDSISHEHVVFIDCGDYLRVEDVSRNGTFIERNGVKRKLTKHVIEVLRPDDILYFGFFDQPFDALEILTQIKSMRSPVGSQRVRCAVHGIIYMANKSCPLCPK
jgi:FHA domain